jgi:phenylacetate-coenzyme A ligase PaaK-like adenylate-forming protein
VDGPTFKARLREAAGVEQVVNYYGMVEQTGSIFMECAEGRMHCSVFSDVFVRRHSDFSLCGVGERGLLQVVSVLPASYPGHSLITEDVGILLGEDDCPCGRLGKSFLVEGRIAEAEVRGCSDTHAPPD